MRVAGVCFCLSLGLLGACGGGESSQGDDIQTSEIRSDSRADVSPDLVQDITPDLADDTVFVDVPADETVDSIVPDQQVDEGLDVGEDTQGGDLGTACDPTKRIGRFQVGMKKFGSEFSGRVFDSVDFNGVPTVKDTEGPCRILQRKPWFCDPPCQPGNQCTSQGTCVAMPAPVDVGQVSVTGLSAPIQVSPDAGLNYTFLDFDSAPFEPGAALELSAQGKEFAAFQLSGTGVEPLVLESIKWTLVMNEPFVARWTAGTTGATVLISLNVDQHGSTPATLVCEVADDGEYEISAEMVSALLLFGVNGAPTAYVFRRTIDSVELDQGCVEFEVYSQVNLVVATE